MTDPVDPEQDPGWPRGASALVFMIPGMMVRRSRHADDGLLVLRQVLLSFTVSLVLFGCVLTAMRTQGGETLRWLAVLVALAVASVVAVNLTATRPLDCSSPERLAGSYRTRVFLRLAYANSVAMFGFVFAFIGGGAVMYYAGAAFALVRFWSGIAPTRKTLAREQDELNARGCVLNLVAALRTAGPPAK